MINLVGKDYSIHIHEDNPAYETLMKFSGDLVSIQVQTEQKIEPNKNTENTETPQKETNLYGFKLNRKQIWDSFYDTFFQEEEETIPAYLTTLENYLENALGGKTGEVEVEQIKENVFRTKNDYYIVWRKNL